MPFLPRHLAVEAIDFPATYALFVCADTLGGVSLLNVNCITCHLRVLGLISTERSLAILQNTPQVFHSLQRLVASQP